MTPVFPLDGPCTQLCCLSCCSLPLTFALIDFWPTDGKPLQTTSSADQRNPDLQDSLLIVPGKSAFTASFDWSTTIHVGQLHNYLFMQTDVFPPLHHTKKNIISVISMRWEKSQVLLPASLAKQQQWVTGYNMFPSDEEVVCSPDWRCDHFTKRQPQTEEFCAGEVTNSLKWRQHLIVGCDLSLTASCWTHIPVAAMMDFFPRASRRPLWVERPSVGIFLTSQGSICSCYDEIHPHMPTRGHLVSEDVSALRKELDQQAPMGTELGNKWTFYFKKQNVNFGSPNSVLSVFSHLTLKKNPNSSFFPLNPLWCQITDGGKKSKSPKIFPHRSISKLGAQSTWGADSLRTHRIWVVCSVLSEFVGPSRQCAQSSFHWSKAIVTHQCQCPN